MEYKTCKHEHDNRCRECQCGSWCNEILTCTCGCHDKPTYSYGDYTNAKFTADTAQTSLKLVASQQRREREQIEQRLAQLNADYNPFLDKSLDASRKLDDMKRRLLGPWQNMTWDHSSVHIYVLNGDRAWYDSRVWLRIAGFAGNRWALRVQHYDNSGSMEWIFDPPTANRKEDMEANKRRAEEYIVKMGFILPQK